MDGSLFGLFHVDISPKMFKKSCLMQNDLK